METETPEVKFLEGMDPAQKAFFELAMRQEELHPELSPYLQPHPTLGQCLKHPLVFELFYHPQSNARLNEQYKQKLKYVEEKLADKKWSSAIWLYERPYRMEKFAEWMHDMTDSEYWDLLGSIWTDSENLWQYGSLPGYLLRKDRPGRENMMDASEKKFLAGLPEEFVVYRGFQRRNKKGWSWSLSYHKAKWFAERFDQKGAGVIQATVKKKDVIAYLSGRNEYEIVADFKSLTSAKVMKPRKRKPWMQAVLDDAIAGMTLKGKSHHGVAHWEKVERNALALHKINPESDKLVVQLFALLHDSRRINEDDDPEHGERAAKYVEFLYKKNFLPIGPVQKDLLVYACRHHEKGETTENATIGVCWDADRLDLPRVGIVPDPKLLSTKAGKEMIWRV
jgi:hypothetical protein